ncbi:MAG: DUF3127 domain-containing protein [Flavobacteriales bacterium]|nr:DUF3127 domain-containing protein [Flavobacteriales bacterium]
MELTGKMKVIGEEKSFPSGFTKREFVITTEEQYPNDVQFELLKEKGSLLESYKVGDRVLVSFDVRGREWQGKYFNSLVAWKLQAAGSAVAESAPQPAPASFGEPEPDDLPF